MEKATFRPPSPTPHDAGGLLATMPAAVVAAEIGAGLADEAVTRRVAVVVGIVVDPVPAMAGMGVRIIIAVGVAGAEAIVVGAVVIGVSVALAERPCRDHARGADGAFRHIARPGERIVVPALVPVIVPVLIPSLIPSSAIAVIAIGQTALIVAGVGITRSLVLAIGVWIELRAIAGIVDHFLRQGRARHRCGENGGGAENRKFRHACLHWSARTPMPDVGARVAGCDRLRF